MANGESPIITLNLANDLRVRQLRAKLGEYQSRVNIWKAPELQRGTFYKITILERLLMDGTVDTWELSREMNEKDGSVDFDRWNTACSVINAYASTGGEGLVGGGLPQV
jgi:hypothetical protein